MGIGTRYELPNEVLFVHLPKRYASTGDDSINALPLLPRGQKILGRFINAAYVIRSMRSF